MEWIYSDGIGVDTTWPQMLFWYLNTIHWKENRVHVCYVYVCDIDM